MPTKSVVKKTKNKLISSITPKYRVEQFLIHFCVSGNILFGKFCEHNVDRKCVNTCKEHLWSKSLVNKGETLLHTLHTIILKEKEIMESQFNLNEKEKKKTNLNLWKNKWSLLAQVKVYYWCVVTLDYTAWTLLFIVI